MQLLRNYTQNIDTLESLAGVEKVLQCHGRCFSISPSLNEAQDSDRIVQDCFLSSAFLCPNRTPLDTPLTCQRCKTRVPGKAIEPHIMSQTIPFCDLCRATRAEELARSQAAKKARRKAKGKGKAPGWGSSGSESSEEDEWGGGEPGIMKVSEDAFQSARGCD